MTDALPLDPKPWTRGRKRFSLLTEAGSMGASFSPRPGYSREQLDYRTLGDWQSLVESGGVTVVNGWVVDDAEGCTCYRGGPYGHVSGCGYEPLVELARLLSRET